MKKTSLLLLLLLLAIAGFSVLGFGQGVITFDGSLASSPKVFYNSMTDFAEYPDTTVDINAELLYSVNPGDKYSFWNYLPVVTLLLSATNATYGVLPVGAVEPAEGDITLMENGTLLDPTFNVYQFDSIAPGTVVNFIVAGWFGNYSSIQKAAASGAVLFGFTTPFQETLSSPTSPVYANISDMPRLPMLYIPEPASWMLAGLGFGFLFMFRHKQR